MRKTSTVRIPRSEIESLCSFRSRPGTSVLERVKLRDQRAVQGRVLLLAAPCVAVLAVVAHIVLKLVWAESAPLRCFWLHGDAALRACQEVITSDWPPAIRAEGYYNRGVELDQLARHAEAVLSYEQAVRLKPDYAAAYTNMAITLAKLRRWDDAVRAYRAAIRERPDYGDAYYNLGLTLADLGRWPDALDAFREAIKLNPADADALYNMGFMLNRLGRPEEAAHAYTAAVRVRPNYADAWGNLGMTTYLLGRQRDSVLAFERARMLVPTYFDGRDAQRQAWEQSRQERPLVSESR